MTFENTLEFAQNADAQDSLKQYRDEFFFPQHNGENVIYFTGNSLGLQPKSVINKIKVELDDWAKYGVEGHFDGTNPWFHYHKFFNESAARVVGAKPEEVVVMNNLT